MKKWYLSTWFIALLFGFWFLVIPLIFGIYLIIKQKAEFTNLVQQRQEETMLEMQKRTERIIAKSFNNIELREVAHKDKENQFKIEADEKRKEILLFNLVSQLNWIVAKQELNDHLVSQSKELENQSVAIKKELHNSNRVVSRKFHQLRRLKGLLDSYKKEVITFKDEILYQSFGFYDYHYQFENSQKYKDRLEIIRKEQKEAVRDNLAIQSKTNWLLNNSYHKGQVMNNKNIKMTIRSFNNECDAVIHKVKFSNIQSSEKRILKAKEQIDKLNSYNDIVITEHYLHLKLEELHLAYEYAKKKNDELEEQRHRKQLLREEMRAQKEIEERLKVLVKEQKHFQNALNSYLNQLENSNEKLNDNLRGEIQKLEAELKKIDNERSELDYRVRNAKAGFVYVISNIGAFGEDVYKIGMTRRLEPLDRIKELSSASTPFPYDIHAMIFSENAPALENELHKAFKDKRVNKVNNRKEFFRVSLKEIEEIVREHYNKPVEFTRLGIAKEYRETTMIERKSQEDTVSNRTVS